jgi:hypothetical protein
MMARIADRMILAFFPAAAVVSVLSMSMYFQVMMNVFFESCLNSSFALLRFVSQVPIGSRKGRSGGTGSPNALKFPLRRGLAEPNRGAKGISGRLSQKPS